MFPCGQIPDIIGIGNNSPKERNKKMGYYKGVSDFYQIKDRVDNPQQGKFIRKFLANYEDYYYLGYVIKDVLPDGKVILQQPDIGKIGDLASELEILGREFYVKFGSVFPAFSFTLTGEMGESERITINESGKVDTQYLSEAKPFSYWEERAEDPFSSFGIGKIKPEGGFIAFEGIDGSGKSTLIKAVREELVKRGLDAGKIISTFEPGGTELGQKIREILLHGEKTGVRTQSALFLADRAHHVEEVIEPALNDGKLVLCDRYISSFWAYQDGVDPNTRIKEYVNWIIKGIYPQIVVYLDISVEEALKRTSGEEKDNIESQGAEYLEKVRERYASQTRFFPWDTQFKLLVLDATLSTEELVEKVLECVDLS